MFFDAILIISKHIISDPKQDVFLKMQDGKHKVCVPQAPAIKQTGFSDSNFSQSEYLVYKESQARMRYILMMEF